VLRTVRPSKLGLTSQRHLTVRCTMASLPISIAPIVRALTSVSYGPLLRPLDAAGLWTFKDVPYLASGHSKHTLDVLVTPPTSATRPLQPVLLFVHGGSWQRGDKRFSLNMYQNVAIAACAANAVGVCVNYRLSPEVTYPSHLDDCAASLRWVFENIAAYGGDPSKVILCGHSAGAHLAANLALASAAGAGYGLSRQVRGLVGLCGVYNVLRLGKSPFARALTEAAFGKSDAALRQASTVYLAAHLQRPFTVPTLLLNAAEDFHLEADAEELDMALATSGGRQQSTPDSSLQAGRRALDRGRRELDAVRAATPGIRWVPPEQCHTPNVTRGVVADSNHLTMIGSVGQPADATSAVIRAFVEVVARSEDEPVIRRERL